MEPLQGFPKRQKIIIRINTLTPQRVIFVRTNFVHLQKMIAADSAHKTMFGKFMDEESQAFKASVNGNNFFDLVEAVRNNRISVFFAIAAGCVCGRRRAEAIGCSVQFPCAIPKWDSEADKWAYMASSYVEDLVVTEPGGGIGTEFFSGLIKIMTNKKKNNDVVSGGIAGEQVWHEGAPIGGVLKKFGAVFADNLDEPVLVFPDDSSKMECVEDSVNVGACDFIYNVDDETVKPHSSFAVEWQGENCGVCATFNDAFSTFEGIATPRALFASHGVLPEKDKLKNILSVMMDCGVNEIKKKGWVKGEDVKSLLRIHVLRQSNIHQALVSLGAVPRTLGNDINPIPMYPFMIDLAKGKDCTILKAVP